MKRLVVLGSAIIGGILLAGSPVKAQVSCVWADATNTKSNLVKAETPALLKGAYNPAVSGPAAEYEWSYTSSAGATGSSGRIAIDNGNNNNTFNLDFATPDSIYTLATDTDTATLRVYAASGSQLGSCSYKVQVVAGSVDDLRRIAIQDGLWYLHKKLRRYTVATLHGSAMAADVENSYGAGVPMVGQTFVDAGFRANGNAATTYTMDLELLVNFVTERLAIAALPKDGTTNPENRGNGVTGLKDGFGVYYLMDETEYGFGPALRFLAACGYTDAAYNAATAKKPATHNPDLNYDKKKFPNGIRNWNFYQIVQQMVDWIAWSQLVSKGNLCDYTGTYYTDPVSGATYWAALGKSLKSTELIMPGTRGAWPYVREGWGTTGSIADNSEDGTYGDRSVSYWTTSGLSALDATKFPYPTFIKTQLNNYLLANTPCDNAQPDNFGPMANWELVERAGQGLAMFGWMKNQISGLGSTGTRPLNCLTYITDRWANNTFEHGQNHPSIGDVCTGTSGTPVTCYSHFDPAFYEAGHFECLEGALSGNQCVGNVVDWGTAPPTCDLGAFDDVSGQCVIGLANWVVDYNYRKFNVFAFKTITEGLLANGYDFPVADGQGVNYASWKDQYREYLIDNQFSNGGWDDNGWITGQAFGTAWAIQSLLKL